jgi:hypothetical protein
LRGRAEEEKTSRDKIFSSNRHEDHEPRFRFSSFALNKYNNSLKREKTIRDEENSQSNFHRSREKSLERSGSDRGFKVSRSGVEKSFSHESAKGEVVKARKY